MARGWEENRSEYNDWEEPMRVGRSLWGWTKIRMRWPGPGFWKQYDYHPWFIVTLALMALPWAMNCFFGAFLFISGNFIIDSIIPSAVIAFIALAVWFRKRSYDKIAREIEQEYADSRKDGRKG